MCQAIDLTRRQTMVVPKLKPIKQVCILWGKGCMFVCRLHQAWFYFDCFIQRLE